MPPLSGIRFNKVEGSKLTFIGVEVPVHSFYTHIQSGAKGCVCV